MRFKIVIDLDDNDYDRMKDVLDENPDTPLELLSGEDFEFVEFHPFLVSVEGFGYSLSGMVSFQERIGLDVFKFLELDKESSKILSVNFKNIKLKKIVLENF